MDREALESLDREGLIRLVLGQAEAMALLAKQVEALTARVAELEAKLGLAPKTPDNSSLPPSKGQKPSASVPAKPKRNPHPGAHRRLHPNPSSRVDCRADRCQHCGGDVSRTAQRACEAYDRVEIPDIKPDVTRVTLFGGDCPCCRKRFKACAPTGFEPGSPFGENLRAFVLYLRSVQCIPLARLCDLLHDLIGLDISEGALVAILKDSAPAFAKQTSFIKARLLSGTALACDETGLRVGKANFWQWIFHHGDSAAFVVDPHRSKAVVAAFLGDWRPDFWLSDRLGSQMGWARRGHQVCLAHLIRDTRYAIEAGDEIFAPGLKGLFKRACAIARRRDRLADNTLKVYRADLERRLDRLLALKPEAASGKKLQRAIKKFRQNLFVFMENREIEPTNNGSERGLRPCAIYRKVTNGFRAAWAAVHYADVRSVIETARRRGLRALHAIRMTLAGQTIPLTA